MDIAHDYNVVVPDLRSEDQYQNLSIVFLIKSTVNYCMIIQRSLFIFLLCSNKTYLENESVRTSVRGGKIS